MNLCKSANGGDGISDIERNAARASGERFGKRASFKFADEISSPNGAAIATQNIRAIKLPP